MGITTTVRDIVTKDIISVKTTDPVKKAIDLMVKHDIGSVIVIENGKPVGILTERDIMKKFAHKSCVQVKSKPEQS